MLKIALYRFRFLRTNIEFLAGACDYEFSEPEMEILNSFLVKLVPNKGRNGTDRYDYLQNKYRELNMRDIRKDLAPLKNRFAFLRSVLKIEVGD